MTTAVPGLIKIGKTGTANYEQRMYDPEHDGYRNVTALKCSFAIVTQLLSSFDGVVIFPKTETKAEVFDAAVDNAKGKLLPDGTYTFKRKKKSDNKVVTAAAVIDYGRWTLLKGSVPGVAEDAGVSQKAKTLRMSMPTGLPHTKIFKNGRVTS